MQIFILLKPKWSPNKINWNILWQILLKCFSQVSLQNYIYWANKSEFDLFKWGIFLKLTTDSSYIVHLNSSTVKLQFVIVNFHILLALQLISLPVFIITSLFPFFPHEVIVPRKYVTRKLQPLHTSIPALLLGSGLLYHNILRYLLVSTVGFTPLQSSDVKGSFSTTRQVYFY